MSGEGAPAVRIPAWLRELGVPAWVSGPDQSIVYLNALAESLLGISSREARGLRCHQLIGACDDKGNPVCRPECLLVRRVRAGERLPPSRLIVLGGRGEQHWLRLMPIRLELDDLPGNCVVHCVLHDDRAHRVESYLRHVARRSGVPHGPSEPLTPREWEVLELLSQDLTVRDIAVRLGVSYATVRNHVQHLLRKLEVHSIAEAVALHLLQSRP